MCIRDRCLSATSHVSLQHISVISHRSLSFSTCQLHHWYTSWFTWGTSVTVEFDWTCACAMCWPCLDSKQLTMCSIWVSYVLTLHAPNTLCFVMERHTKWWTQTRGWLCRFLRHIITLVWSWCLTRTLSNLCHFLSACVVGLFQDGMKMKLRYNKSYACSWPTFPWSRGVNITKSVKSCPGFGLWL